MKRTPKRVAMLAALLTLALFVAACGSSSKDKGGSVKSSAGQKIPQGKSGGELTVLSAGDVDYMDPGQMYYTFGYMIGYSVNRPLYSFKPDDAEHPVPDVAAGPPVQDHAWERGGRLARVRTVFNTPAMAAAVLRVEPPPPCQLQLVATPIQTPRTSMEPKCSSSTLRSKSSFEVASSRSRLSARTSRK